jgi:hypothetical protein
VNRTELQALPLEERRRLQREAGLVTSSFIEQQRGHKQPEPNKKETSNMETQNPQSHETARTRARQSVEDFLTEVQSGESLPKTAKRAGVYAAIWAPVAIGVGYTLLRIGKKMFTPAPM